MLHTVLSVDADAAVRRARDEVFRKTGFDVIEAATGADALRLASEKQPVLIVLAIELPVMDGFAVAKRLKSDPRTASIPVLHISSQGEPHRDYPLSVESGADAWLQEPVEPRLLAGVAGALIRAAATARQAGLDAAQKLSALIDSIPDEGRQRKQAEAALDAHRQLMEAVVNHLPVGVAFVRGRDLTLQLLNPAYQALAPGKEMMGKTLQEVWPETQPLFAERCRQVLETGAPFHAVDEPFMVSRSGGGPLESSYFSWSIDRVSLPGEDGWGILLSVSETTERKRAEEALRESEAVLRGFFDSPGMMRGFVELVDGRIIHVSCNAAAAELFGLDRESIAGKSAAEAGAPAEVARLWVDLYEKSRRTGQPVSMEYARRAADGGERWLLATASCLGAGRSGNPRFAYTILDLTDRKRAEEALRASEKMYRAIGESIDYGVWVCAPDGRNTYASESFLKQVGLTQEQCSNFGWGGVLHPDDAERTVAAWKECVRTEGTWDIEHRFRGVDGEWHPVLARGVPVRDDRGQIACWVGINLDIGALKRTEESLRESERRERARAAELEALMDAAPAGIFVAHDVACSQMTGNPAAYDLLRRPTGSNLSKSGPETEKPVNFRALNGGIEIPLSELPMQKAALTGQPVRKYEMDFVFEDGSITNTLGDAVPLLDEDGRPRGAVGVFVDITELKRAETRLREAQKLKSIGLLAGGVAHDFNNLLVGVIGNASLAKELLPPDNPTIDLLDGVIRTGEQAAHLTRQMLAYSGKGKFVVEALHLSRLIPDMIGLLRPSIPKKIVLRLDLEEDLPPVEADRGQLQQVFMNLVLNAAEAIGSQDGLISVRTGVQDVDDRYLRRYAEAASLQPGKHVFLEVRDTGSGMDDATRARIFEPFFSTKFTGRGLGLAAVAGIVRGHKGAILVGSAPGKGSCFTVLFPASERAAGQPLVAAPAAEVQGAGTVLVVDDEQVVREMAKRALERRGYTVLLADSGLEAIDVFTKHPGDIALVVLDLSMPHMSGEEALPELRKIRPGMKVVVSSGYSQAEAMMLFRGQRVSGFIQKPYTAQKIAETVKACLA